MTDAHPGPPPDAAEYQELRREHTLLRAILGTSVAAVTVLSEDGHIVFANDRAERILGLDKSRLTGRLYNAPEWKITAVEGGPFPDEELPFVRVMRSGEPVFDVRHAIEWPDGRRHVLSINGAPLRDDAGRLTGAVFQVDDITDRLRAEEERRRMERRLHEAERLESLGVLAGGVAHDFNNLLTSILGGVGMAQKHLPPGSPAAPFLEQVEQVALRAADLCKQMLAYAGKGRFLVRPTDLNQLLRESVTLLHLTIGRHVTLRYELAETLPAVAADAAQLRQVVLNLVQNAAEAIADAGEIVLATGVVHADRALLTATYHAAELPEGDYVFLEVRDTGSGMTAEVRARAFEPFFSTKFAGRGLGLPAVLGIVRGHRGAVHLASELGRGTTVRVLLPV